MANDELMQTCLSDCLKCYELCMQLIPYCLEKGGKHANPEHMKLLMDCAEMCQTSANFLLRGSKQHASTCTTCALICRVCGISCDEFGEDDEQMKACAAACFKCAESCEAMAAA
jgi:hypothetical protein